MLLSDEDAVTSDLGSSTIGKGRAREIKSTKAVSKRKAQMGLVSDRLEGLMGELAKVRKIVSDFRESQVGQSIRGEEMMMLPFFPEDSNHRKMILERIIGSLESRIGDDDKWTGHSDNADGLS